MPHITGIIAHPEFAASQDTLIEVIWSFSSSHAKSSSASISMSLALMELTLPPKPAINNANAAITHMPPTVNICWCISPAPFFIFWISKYNPPNIITMPVVAIASIIINVILSSSISIFIASAPTSLVCGQLKKATINNIGPPASIYGVKSLPMAEILTICL